MLFFFKILKFRLRKGEPKVAYSPCTPSLGQYISRRIRDERDHVTRIAYTVRPGGKVKPNDVTDSWFRQSYWSFLTNVSQVAIYCIQPESMHRKWAAESRYRDYRIERNFGRDYGIEKPFRGPSWYPQDLSVVDLRRNWSGGIHTTIRAARKGMVFKQLSVR